MTPSSTSPAPASYTPPTLRPSVFEPRMRQPTDNEPPQKPDWLLIMVVVLFVVTLSIAWYISV